jgi:lipase
MRPIERRLPVNHIELTVYEWEGRDPAVIFLHATGFHGRCWDEVIRQLGDRHCYAVDVRGHGRSDKPEPPHPWQQFGLDAAQVARQLELKGAVGVGHSMGGNALVRAAAGEPDAFAALLLVDPVILPAHWYHADEYSIDGHFVLNRRRQWSSPDEMFERFKGRGPFANWQDVVLRDYCRYGLLPADEGNDYQLACPPEVEAHIYASSSLASNRDIYDAVAQVTVPVRVLRCAKPVSQVGVDLMDSPTAPDLASRFAHGEDIALPDYSHFIPMESPELVARHIDDLLRALER